MFKEQEQGQVSINLLMTEQDNRIFFSVKDYLSNFLDLQLKVDTLLEGEGYCLLNYFKDTCKTHQDIEIKEQKLREKLLLLNDKLTYYISKGTLIITQVDPKIVAGKEAAIKQSVMEKLACEFNSLQIENENENEAAKIESMNKTPVFQFKSPEENKFSYPTSNQPFIFSAPKLTQCFSATPKIEKQDLNDFNKIRKIIQQAYNLDDVKYKKKPLRQKILCNFNKYKSLIEDSLIPEFICRGDMESLKTLKNITCVGKVEHTTTQISSSDSWFFHNEPKHKKKKTTETYEYRIKANFDPAAFVRYVKEKKALATDTVFLGFQSNVEKCIQYICGADVEKAQALITGLNKLNAYTKPVFEFNF